MHSRWISPALAALSLAGLVRLYIDIQILFHGALLRELTFESPMHFVSLFVFWILGFTAIPIAIAGKVRLPMFEVAFLVGFVLSVTGMMNSAPEDVTLSIFSFSLMALSVTASCVLVSVWFDHRRSSTAPHLVFA